MTVYCLLEVDGTEIADASLRALTFGRGLADALSAALSPAGARLAAVVFGEPPEADLGRYGVTDVIAMTGIDGYAPQAWARAIATVIDDTGLDNTGLDNTGPGETQAVLAAATDRGNEVMAHLGAITGLPMAANCVAVAPAADGGYALVRQRWAGLLLEEALLDGPVAVLTVATDAVPAGTPNSTPDVSAETPAPEAPAVRRATPPVDAADLMVQAIETLSGAGGASLATARVVIGGGRGVGSAGGFAPLEELAALLGGVVGVSRVVTSEGWRPHSMQVGQTGTKITPDLYLACGISGAIQHIAGCAGARHLIAINKDPSAPMMTRADYAVVGDSHEIVPALVRAIRDRSVTAPEDTQP